MEQGEVRLNKIIVGANYFKYVWEEAALEASHVNKMTKGVHQMRS